MGGRSSTSGMGLASRLSGDALLDAQDMVDELRSNGASIDSNGIVTLFHHTTQSAADEIKRTGVMTAKEDGVFFTTKADSDSMAGGRGDAILKFGIPVEKLQIDDEFGDEAHVRIPLSSRRAKLNVRQYLR